MAEVHDMGQFQADGEGLIKEKRREPVSTRAAEGWAAVRTKGGVATGSELRISDRMQNAPRRLREPFVYPNRPGDRSRQACGKPSLGTYQDS